MIPVKTGPTHTCASGNNLPNSTKVFTTCVGSIRILQISCRCRFDKARRLGGIAAMRVIGLATIAITGPHIQCFSYTCMKTRCPFLAYVNSLYRNPVITEGALGIINTGISSNTRSISVYAITIVTICMSAWLSSTSTSILATIRRISSPRHLQGTGTSNPLRLWE